MKRFDSPFVCEDEREVTTQEMTKELFFALVICGLSVAEIETLLSRPKQLAREARRFGKMAGKVISKTESFSILDSFAQFKKYLADSTALPWHVIPRELGQAQSISHWSHSMEVTLRSKAGWTASEIEERPMQKAMIDFFKYLESEGVVDLITHEAYGKLVQTGETNARAFLAHLEYMEGMKN